MRLTLSHAGCDVFVFGTGAAASELSEVKPDAADTLELTAAKPSTEVLRKTRLELRKRTPPDCYLITSRDSASSRWLASPKANHREIGRRGKRLEE